MNTSSENPFAYLMALRHTKKVQNLKTRILFTRSSETFCFFWGFEQLPIFIGWQVTTGRIRATI